VLRAVLMTRYGVSERSAAQSMLKIHAAMALIDEVRDGGDHLVGDGFTVADLAAAALLAPLLAPPQLPYRDPEVAGPPDLERIAGELRALPAGQWVMGTYAAHRPPSAAIGEEEKPEAATAPAGAAR